MGQGLGLALKRRGYKVVLVTRTPRDVIPPLVLHQGSRAEATAGAELVLIATPDDAIADGGRRARGRGRHHPGPGGPPPVGPARSQRAAAAGGDRGGCGSFHPLQSVAEPGTAAERLKGAYVGIEGDDRALVAAERLANTLRMIPVRIPAAAKPAYHAGGGLRRQLHGGPGRRGRAARTRRRRAARYRGPDSISRCSAGRWPI